MRHMTLLVTLLALLGSCTLPACEVCGTEFRARRADARCCSARCRQKASRGRRAAPLASEDAAAGTSVHGHL